MKFKTELGKLILGDCRKIMPKLKAQSFDMILCDLPYGITACKWDSIIPFKDLWENYLRLIKPRGAIVLTASQPFTSFLVCSQPKLFRHEWIWKKNAGSNFAQTKYAPMKEHESVLVFGKVSPNYYPIKQVRNESGLKRAKYSLNSAKPRQDGVYATTNKNGYSKESLSTMRCPSSLQLFNRERGLHPTQKPVALFEYLIRTYSKPGNRVLDNCIGSGTTAVACENLGRRWVGIEKDPEYFDVAVNRIKNLNRAAPQNQKLGVNDLRNRAIMPSRFGKL